MSNIFVVRLTVGYDIIGEISDMNDEKILLIHPFRPLYDYNEKTGATVIQLIQWLNHELIHEFDQVEIFMKDIIFVKEVSEIMLNLYLKTKEGILKKIKDGDFNSKIKTMDEIRDEELNDRIKESGPPKGIRKLQ